MKRKVLPIGVPTYTDKLVYLGICHPVYRSAAPADHQAVRFHDQTSSRRALCIFEDGRQHEEVGRTMRDECSTEDVVSNTGDGARDAVYQRAGCLRLRSS